MMIKSGGITRFKFHFLLKGIKAKRRKLQILNKFELNYEAQRVVAIDISLMMMMMMGMMRRMMSICIWLTSELTIEQYVVHPKLMNEIDNKKKGL